LQPEQKEPSMAIADAGTAPARARPVAWGVTVAAIVVALAAGALIAVSIATAPSPASGGGSQTAQSQAALGQAGQIVVDFTSFDYKTLTQDQSRIAADLTPTFRQTYLSQSRPLNAVIIKAKSVATSQVVASGLSSYDPVAGKASAIVAVNVTSRNIKTKGTVQYYRFSVQLQQVGGKWLASNVGQE
jgi:Mce-associated membrane protein